MARAKAASGKALQALNGGNISDVIRVRGARQHNLKDVDLALPRNKLVVFTGVSGSGKSSLAFDTIFAEGQRRYVESLSTYARQFLARSTSPMLMPLRDYHRRFRLIRNPPAITLAPPWAPSRRFRTT